MSSTAINLTSLRLTDPKAQVSASSEVKAKEKAKIKEASRQMEAMFLSLLWKEMRKTVNKSGFMDGGQGEKMFTDMLDRSIADASVKGGSMGLADMIEQQLTPKAPIKPDTSNGYLRNPIENINPQAGIGYFKNSKGEDYQIPVQGVVSSAYGPRIHPITGEHKDHKGLDLAAPEGSSVKAAKEGKVVFAGEKGGYGNLVVLEHQGGQTSYYGHLKDIKVTKDQKVKAGEFVGTVGQTGLATGPHLHFEVRGVDGKAFDPSTVLAMGSIRTT